MHSDKGPAQEEISINPSNEINIQSEEQEKEAFKIESEIENKDEKEDKKEKKKKNLLIV